MATIPDSMTPHPLGRLGSEKGYKLFPQIFFKVPIHLVVFTWFFTNISFRQNLVEIDISMNLCIKVQVGLLWNNFPSKRE